jgi:hypothetical protein
LLSRQLGNLDQRLLTFLTRGVKAIVFNVFGGSPAILLSRELGDLDQRLPAFRS